MLSRHDYVDVKTMQARLRGVLMLMAITRVFVLWESAFACRRVKACCAVQKNARDAARMDRHDAMVAHVKGIHKKATTVCTCLFSRPTACATSP
jgi:hypothetical protein